MDKILVVDDEKKMRHILQLMLEREGFSAEQAGNGKEALDMLKRKRFDMVITDLKMPEMGGMALLEEAKKLDPDFPILVITAYGHDTPPFDGHCLHNAVFGIERVNLSIM